VSQPATIAKRFVMTSAPIAISRTPETISIAR
jgi:hypothetical protein